MSQQQNDSVTPKYVEAYVAIHSSRPDRGFAFGTIRINDVSTEVFVGSKCHAAKDGNGRWEKKEPMTPIEDDLLFAKICTEVDPGKKPFAVFWEVRMNMHTDDGFDHDAIDEDDDYLEECEWCGVAPCRCEPED